MRRQDGDIHQFGWDTAIGAKAAWRMAALAEIGGKYEKSERLPNAYIYYRPMWDNL